MRRSPSQFFSRLPDILSPSGYLDLTKHHEIKLAMSALVSNFMSLPDGLQQLHETMASFMVHVIDVANNSTESVDQLLLMTSLEAIQKYMRTKFTSELLSDTRVF